MTYKIIVSDRAKQMLAIHLRFLAKENKTAAQAAKKRLVEGMRSLSDMPSRFPFFSEQNIPPNKYHKMYVDNWYLVLFQIKDQTVYVDYILDCRQDYQWLVK